MGEVVLLDCNRRCGTRFAYTAWTGESAAAARRSAVCAAEAAGWRNGSLSYPKRGGLRCAGCFARYGDGDVLLPYTMQAKDVLAALYDCAQKCDVCGECVATRAGDDLNGVVHRVVCDRESCGNMVRCDRCGRVDIDQPIDDGWHCAWCGPATAHRIERSCELGDLQHADALRAANATHEAKR